jgi:hypothetical protein
MRGIVIVLLMGLCEMALSQTPKPSPASDTVAQTAKPPKQPDLSRNVTLQMQQLAEELKQIQKDFAAVDHQVRTENPGWHLANDLNIVPDAPASNVVPKKE